MALPAGEDCSVLHIFIFNTVTVTVAAENWFTTCDLLEQGSTQRREGIAGALSLLLPSRIEGLGE